MQVLEVIMHVLKEKIQVLEAIIQVPEVKTQVLGSKNAGPWMLYFGAGVDVGRKRNSFKEEESIKWHNIGV